MEIFYMATLRIILGIKWQDKNTNTHVLEETCCSTLILYSANDA